MKNPRAFLFALIVALLATVAQCRYVATREQALLYETEPQKTLVAKKDILDKVRIDETMVEVIDVPRKWQQPQALSSVDEVRGQISAVPILAGQQISASQLQTPDEAGLALYLPSGMRAISLDVTVSNAVGGHIRPYNYVDIIGTFDFGTGDKSDVRAVTLMQDVLVLAVVDDIGRPTLKDIQPNREEGAPPREEKGASEDLGSNATITIAVRPADAQKLVLAQQIGDLTVSLRPRDESHEPVTLDQATVSSTLGIVQQVRYRSGSRYRVIEGGGY